jgi:hypothetical protein
MNKGALRQKERIGGANTMYQAFMQVQSAHSVYHGRVCMAGFLRDDGTAACKKNDWAKNSPSLYKAVLLCLDRLEAKGVAYHPELRSFEDISFATDVLEADGGTLKCMQFCFRAVVRSSGGAAGQRNNLGTADSIASASSTCSLVQQPEGIKRIRDWVEHHEHMYDKKKQNSGISF